MMDSDVKVLRPVFRSRRRNQVETVMAVAAAMHDEHDVDPNSSEGEGEMEDSLTSASGRAAGMGGGGASQFDSGDVDSKRKRRLELNRKAAKESRRRKKMRIEELGRSVVFLTKENQELREQNELLRQMVATEVPPENSLALSKYQAENAALRMALYEAVKHDMVFKHDQASGINTDGAAATTSMGGGSSSSNSGSSDHTLPSLAAAAAAVGSGQSSVPQSASGPVQSALALLASLPPLPPPLGNRLAGLGGNPGAHAGPSSMSISSSPMKRPQLSEGKGGVASGGESLLEVGRNGSGGGSGMGSGGPFLSGGPGGRGGVAGSGGDAGGRVVGPPTSMGGYVGAMAGGGEAGGGGRSSGPSSSVQQSGYTSPSYALSTLESTVRKMDRGLSVGASGGSGGGAGDGGNGGNGAGSAETYGEMVARSSPSSAVQRARSMQQQRGGSGGGSRGGGGSREDNVMSGAGGSGRRLSPGNWAAAGVWRENMGSSGGGSSAAGSVGRGL